MTTKEKRRYGKESFKTLAYKYQLSQPTFMKNIKSIRSQLDACVGRSNYRNLLPKQIDIIIEHLGDWSE
ncbi:MAG: hypothetical protein WAQ28_13580 [Bacteroidia bacterium]|jgi:hypothetical protein